MSVQYSDLNSEVHHTTHNLQCYSAVSCIQPFYLLQQGHFKEYSVVSQKVGW